MPDAIRSTETSRRGRRIAAAALVGGLLLAVAPGTAMAASAFVTQTFAPNGRSTATAQFLAATGEVNNVRVNQRGQNFDFSDSNRTIVVGNGCRRRGPVVVRCSPSDLNPTTVAPARVRVGNLNDVALIERGRATLNGGSGNDTLTTNAQTVNTTLSGGVGNDVLSVSPNTTVGHSLNGNGGRDTITGGPFGDAISGGFGDDPDIDALGGADEADGDDGNDNITGGTGDDRLLGGDGDDRLFGNSGRDRLRGQNGNDGLAGGRNNDRLGGGPNRDRLFGNTGNDLLVGNSGVDRFRAGPNNDRLRSVDGNRERVNCGTGFDRARVDRMPRDRTAFCNVVARITFRR